MSSFNVVSGINLQAINSVMATVFDPLSEKGAFKKAYELQELGITLSGELVAAPVLSFDQSTLKLNDAEVSKRFAALMSNLEVEKLAKLEASKVVLVLTAKVRGSVKGKTRSINYEGSIRAEGNFVASDDFNIQMVFKQAVLDLGKSSDLADLADLVMEQCLPIINDLLKPFSLTVINTLLPSQARITSPTLQSNAPWFLTFASKAGKAVIPPSSLQTVTKNGPVFLAVDIEEVKAIASAYLPIKQQIVFTESDHIPYVLHGTVYLSADLASLEFKDNKIFGSAFVVAQFSGKIDVSGVPDFNLHALININLDVELEPTVTDMDVTMQLKNLSNWRWETKSCHVDEVYVPDSTARYFLETKGYPAIQTAVENMAANKSLEVYDLNKVAAVIKVDIEDKHALYVVGLKEANITTPTEAKMQLFCVSTGVQCRYVQLKGSVLNGGSTIDMDHYLASEDEKHILYINSAGCIILFDAETQEVLWKSKANRQPYNGKGPWTLISQEDANLVLYDGKTPVWASGTQKTIKNTYSIKLEKGMVNLYDGQQKLQQLIPPL